MNNLVGHGDVSQFPFDKIYELFRRYSHIQARSSRGFRDIFHKNVESVTGGVTKNEHLNLFESFKSDLLENLNLHLDVLLFKKKQEEESAMLSILSPRCRQKHPLRECSMDVSNVFVIFLGSHLVKDCPSLDGLKEIYHGGNKVSKHMYVVGTKKH